MRENIIEKYSSYSHNSKLVKPSCVSKSSRISPSSFPHPKKRKKSEKYSKYFLFIPATVFKQ